LLYGARSRHGFNSRIPLKPKAACRPPFELKKIDFPVTLWLFDNTKEGIRKEEKKFVVISI
jgi:hypothetical protein